MRTEYEVYMDFDRAMEQVGKLRQIAKDVDAIGNDDVGGTKKSIQKDWTGDNSVAYIEKVEIVEGKIIDTGKDIIRIADAVETIAINTRDAELEAIAIARRSS